MKKGFSLRKIVKGLIFSAMAFALFALAAFLVLMRWPETWINPSSLTWVANYLKKYQGISLTWDQIDLEIESLGWFKKEVRLDTRNFCIELTDFRACAERVQAQGVLSWRPNGIYIHELGKIQVDLFRGFIGQETNLIQVLASLKSKDLRNSAHELSGTLIFPDRSKLKLSGTLQLDKVLGIFRLDRIQTHFDLKATYSDGLKAKANLKGDLSKNHLKAHVSGELSKFSKELKRVGLNQCEIDLKRKNKGHALLFEETSSSAHLELSCPTRVDFHQISVPHTAIEVPDQVRARVHASLDFSEFFPSEKSHVKGKIGVHVEPLSTSVFALKADFENKINGPWAKISESWIRETQVNARLEVHEFQNIVKALKRGPYAIPAPLQVLKGKTWINIHGKTDFDVGKLDLEWGSDLTSTHQKLDLSGKGLAEVSRLRSSNGQIPKIQVALDLILSKVQLQLPKLAVAEPPRLVSDTRIKKLRKKKINPAVELHYQVNIRTPSDSPAQLLASFAKQPIPVHLELFLQDGKPLEGKVRIGQVPLELFRRQAKIEFFRIDFAAPVNQSGIEGAISVRLTNITVTLTLGGIFDRPQIRLKSDPPLPEDQLYAALLYGKPAEDLSLDESRTVSNTSTAFQEGALNLASLYFLASTPIQSVAYDSTTGIVTARLKIKEGISLNLGKGISGENGDATQVGVQTRLGGKWTLTTDLTTSSETGSAASAYIQWSHRY